MNISGSTTLFAVLGHPVRHSLSPAMHNASLASLDMDAVYVAFDVTADRLPEIVPAMRDMGFGGINLTVPLKEAVIDVVDNIDADAKRLGAVNTLEFPDDGTIRGHNTDGYGILRALAAAFDVEPEGKRIFVLGCGGAGRGVALTFAECGATRLLLASRNVERAKIVGAEANREFKNCDVEVVASDPSAWHAACREADIVVQCTLVGMDPGDDSLLSRDAFSEGQVAYDLVYMHAETAFMKAARDGGARAANGLGMLLHQGAKSFEIWTGRRADTDAMRGALEAAVYGT